MFNSLSDDLYDYYNYNRVIWTGGPPLNFTGLATCPLNFNLGQYASCITKICQTITNW